MPQSTTVLSSRNHAGLIYLSWKEGEGALIHLWREPQTQQYGLRQIQRPDDDSVLQSCLAVQKTDVFLTTESANEKPVFMRVPGLDFGRVFRTRNLLSFLEETSTDKRIWEATAIGWHDRSFVFPRTVPLNFS